MNCRIIVLNYNGGEILPECLPSLVEAARRASFPTRVAVLDNRSTDGSAAWVQAHFPEVEVIVAPENRFLVSFNDYLPSLEEEIVILMNNDIRVDAGFVDPLVRVFEKHPDAFLASPQSFSFDGSAYEGGRSRAKIRWGLFWSSARFSGYEALRNKPGYTFASGFGAFHRKRFLQLNGYDDLYLPGIMEDADLGFRAWREGYRSYYVPESRVFHLGQASFKKAFGKKGILTLAHRNAFLFVWKNISDASLLWEHFLLLIPRLVVAALKGQSELVTGFFQALDRLPEAGRRRAHGVRRARRDREIFRLASEEPLRRRYLFKKRWKRVLVGIFDALGTVLSFPFRRKRPFPETPRNILVVRTDSLGDGVLTLSAIVTLKKRFPQAQVDFLVGPAVRDLYHILFPDSRRHEMEKNWFATAENLRKFQYDLAIDFRGDLRTILLLSWAGIPDRWGRDGTGGRFLLTRSLSNPYQRHEVLENLELIGQNGSSRSVEFPKVPSRLEKDEAVEKWLSPFGNKKKIVIHLGAGYPSKRWRASHFIELARWIREAGWGVPIFIGSEQERGLFEPYRASLEEGFLELLGKTSLEELLALLKRADLFIGNDSGPAHLAALLDRKILLVFSGTNDFRQWAPWSSRLRILNHPVPCSPCEERACPLERQICLEEISVEDVWQVAKEMLGV